MAGSEVYSDYRLTIAIGDSVVVHAVGRYVTCLEANIDFAIGIGSDALQFMAQGLTVEMAPGETFDKIMLDNTGGASPLVVRVGIGTGNLRDQRLSLTGSIDVSKGDAFSTVADVLLTAAVATVIRAADTARREIIVTNLSANAAVVRIGDVNVAAARGTPIEPGESLILDTTAAVYGYSVPGESVAVSEVSD